MHLHEMILKQTILIDELLRKVVELDEKVSKVLGDQWQLPDR